MSRFQVYNIGSASEVTYKVLGASKIQITSNTNLNDLKTTGVFYACGSSSFVSTLQNKPSDLSVAFGMIIIPTPAEPTYFRQIIFAETGTTYDRVCDNSNFGEWNKYSTNIPSFYKNYSTLASLATAVGGLRIMDRHGKSTDPDTFVETSIGYCEIDANKSPTGQYRGWYYIVIRYYMQKDNVIQIITPDNATTKDVYFRKSHNDGTTTSWTPWTRLAYDIPDFYKSYSSLAELKAALASA